MNLRAVIEGQIEILQGINKKLAPYAENGMTSKDIAAAASIRENALAIAELSKTPVFSKFEKTDKPDKAK